MATNGPQQSASPPAAVAQSPRPSAPAQPSVSPSKSSLPTGVVAEIPLRYDDGTLGIVADDESVWVSSHYGSLLYKVDPTKNAVSARAFVGQTACGSIQNAFGRIWLEPCDDSTQTVGIDTSSNVLAGSLEITSALGFDSNVIWASTTDVAGPELETIDPETLNPTKVTPTSKQYDRILEFDGQIWGLSNLTNSVDRLDPATGKVLVSVPIPLPANNSLYATGVAGALWVMGYRSAQIVRVDLDTNTATAIDLTGYATPTGYFDTPPITALGDVWLRISDSEVARLDAATGAVKATFPAGSGGGMVAVAFGSLWVVNYDAGTLWRIALSP